MTGYGRLCNRGAEHWTGQQHLHRHGVVDGLQHDVSVLELHSASTHWKWHIFSKAEAGEPKRHPCMHDIGRFAHAISRVIKLAQSCTWICRLMCAQAEAHGEQVILITCGFLVGPVIANLGFPFLYP